MANAIAARQGFRYPQPFPAPGGAVQASPSPGRPSLDPAPEYERRRAHRRAQADADAWRERLVGNARVVVFLAGLVVAYFALFAHALSAWWIALPVALFVGLLFVHESVTRDWHRASRAVAFYDAGLARLRFEWKGRGQQGARFLEETHPYAADLDLFGHGSLFELLCTARTRTGEDTLAGWLKAGAEPDEVRARQAAVAELGPKLDLREDLALLGGDLPQGVDFHAVVAWGAEPPILRARWPRWVAFVLGLCAITCLFGWLGALLQSLDPASPFGKFFYAFQWIPLVVVGLIELAFAGWLFGRVHRVLASVERRGRDLALLSSVLACLEAESYTAPRLARLHRELAEGDGTGWMPSQRIAQLGNLIDILNSRRNQFFLPFALLLMWGTQLAHAIEAWRARSGTSIGRWLSIVGEFEALCALAC